MSDNQPQVGTCPTCDSVDPEVCNGTGKQNRPHPHGKHGIYCCKDSFHAVPQPTPAEPRIETVPDVKYERACIAEYLSSKGRTMGDDHGIFESGWLAARFYDIALGRARAGSPLSLERKYVQLWEAAQDFYASDSAWKESARDKARTNLGAVLEATNPSDEMLARTEASPPSSPGAAQTCPTCGDVLLRQTSALTDDYALYCPRGHVSYLQSSPGAPQEQKCPKCGSMIRHIIRRPCDTEDGSAHSWHSGASPVAGTGEKENL